MALFARTGVFDGRCYNVLTLNATAAEITAAIGARVPGMKLEFVDAPLLNQHSYRVSRERLLQIGFAFKGNLGRGIAETLALLGTLAPRAAAQRSGVEP